MFAGIATPKKAPKPYEGPEQRRHARATFSQSLRFKTIRHPSSTESCLAKTKNVGQGGIRFHTVVPPSRKTFVLLDVDTKTLGNLIQIDHHLALIGKRVLGKVIWTHLNLSNGLFDVGVRFVHPSEHIGGVSPGAAKTSRRKPEMRAALNSTGIE